VISFFFAEFSREYLCIFGTGVITWWDSTNSVTDDSDFRITVRCGSWRYLGRWFWVRILLCCVVGDLVKGSCFFWNFYVCHDTDELVGKRFPIYFFFFDISTMLALCLVGNVTGKKSVHCLCTLAFHRYFNLLVCCYPARWKWLVRNKVLWPSTSFQGLWFFNIAGKMWRDHIFASWHRNDSREYCLLLNSYISEKKMFMENLLRSREKAVLFRDGFHRSALLFLPGLLVS
jgi:hypothetical protein